MRVTGEKEERTSAAKDRKKNHSEDREAWKHNIAQDPSPHPQLGNT